MKYIIRTHVQLFCKGFHDQLFDDIMLIHKNRYSKFQSVASITLHFPENFGGDTTQIHYIGLKGEATQVISLPQNRSDGLLIVLTARGGVWGSLLLAP